MTDPDHSKAKAMVGYSFLKVFADGDSLNGDELAFLEKLALEDRDVDDDERAVLSSIFARAEKLGVTPAVHAEIERFKAKHGIP